MKHTIIVAALVLSACSSAEERLCRADLDSSLINPETAKYSDFRKLSSTEVKNDELTSHLAELMESTIPKAGATYATMKVRAEGQLGNTITKHQFCAINAEKTACSCVGAG